MDQDRKFEMVVSLFLNLYSSISLKLDSTVLFPRYKCRQPAVNFPSIFNCNIFLSNFVLLKIAHLYPSMFSTFVKLVNFVPTEL